MITDTPHPRFATAWISIATLLRANPSSSIDFLASELRNQETFILQGKITEEIDIARSLTFAILGWQSMLYQADFGSCPPSKLQIADEMDGYQGESRLQLQQPSISCKSSLPDLLLNFGVLLPPPHFVSISGNEMTKTTRTRRTIEASQLSAAPAFLLAKTEIRWVDSISCHLELDQQRNILYLFRFPSMCSIGCSLKSKHHEKQLLTQPVYACASASKSGKQWADCEETAQLLRELLLSYRILFGQSRQSRRLFRKLRPFKDLQRGCTDPVLLELCGNRKCRDDLQILERDAYSLAQDFPMLEGKLSALADYLSEKRPKTWKQLWQDKRDGGQWFTFWAVLIIGALGLLLALIQVLLQITQLVTPAHS